MNTLFEISYDAEGRLMLLAEDVQRWLLNESQSWQVNAVGQPGFAVTYGHTSTILFGLQEQLNYVQVVPGFEDLSPDDFLDDE